MPAFPAMIGARSVSAPIAAVLPVDVAKRHAASTFGPIDPAAKDIAFNASGDACLICFLRGQSPVDVDSVGVGGPSRTDQRPALSRARATPTPGPCR